MLEWLDAELSDGLTVRLVASDTGIRRIEFHIQDVPESRLNPANPVLVEAIKQLSDYFAGRLRDFRVPLDLQGTDFQKRVWRELETIPFGQTRSYSQIADAIGSPRAVRAVGAANGANPVPIIVPCHRVIGSSGKLVGYGGGLPLKHKLLTLEGVTTPKLPL